MEELINKYPSLIARPYLLIKNDLQKKDMQRFWFENTISFLGSVVGSDLIKWYKELKEKEEKNEAEIELIKKLQNHPSLTNVGLEHMSLGKWVMMLRESIKVLKENNVKATFPELLDFYNKDSEKIINKLVQIRNDDAHGNPIPKDKLEFELNKRQEMINEFVKNLSFLENYQLLFPEKIEIEGNKQFYLLKEFTGNNIITSKKELSFSPRLNDLILINTKTNEYISLLPNVVYLGVIDESKNFLGIFSKFIDKDKKVAKYINLDGNGDIDYRETNTKLQIDFLEERKHIDEIYSDTENFRVNLDIEFEFEDDSMKIDQESSFSLKIDNNKSAPLESLKIILDIPNIMHITNIPTDVDYVENVIVNNNQLIFELKNIEETKFNIDDVKFKILAQGFFSFDRGIVIYEYYKTIADKDAKILTIEDVDFAGASIEVIDLASKDKIVPVINVQKFFLDTEGNSIKHIKIGEDFIFEIKIINIGFSSAKDVNIDVLFPDGLNLKKGKESIKISQLNPLEEKVFQYVFSTKIAGIYNINMQNILYFDINNKRYFTQSGDEYFIIVRSDLLKEFKYQIEEFIEDLHIDEDEQKEIDEKISHIQEVLEIDGEIFYQEAEFESVVNIIRNIVEKIAKKKGISIVEGIYQETKRDAKFTGEDPRKFLVYSSQGFPFFALNLNDLEFYGIRTQITKSFSKVKEKMARVDNGYTLDNTVDYDTVKNTEEYGVAFFNQWVNMILTRLQKEFFIWKAISDRIAETFNTQLFRGNGDFYCPDENIPINIFMHRSKPNTYIISFRSFLKSNKYKALLTKINLFVTHRINTKKASYKEEPNRIGYYWVISDKESSTPAVRAKIESVDEIDKIVTKAKEFYNELLYIQSLELFTKYENEELNDFITKLYKKGFVLKNNTKQFEETKITIVNVKDYPITHESKDAIGYFEETKKGLNIYIKSYSDIENIAEFVKLKDINPFRRGGGNYQLQIKNPKEEILSKTLDYILKTAEEYNKDKLFVYPKPLIKEMIISFGQFEYGIFLVFRAIKENKDISTYFSNEKEYQNSIKNINKLQPLLKIEPIIINDSEINPIYKEVIDEMYQENNQFIYLDDGLGFRRYFYNFIKPLLLLEYNYLEHSMSKNFKLKNDRIKRGWYGLKFAKGKIIKTAIWFDMDKEEFQKAFDDFEFNLDIKQKDDETVLFIDEISIDNFEQNKEQIAKQINEFYGEVDRFLQEKFDIFFLNK